MKTDPQSRITFGKYKDQIWDKIADEDPNYVLWAADNVDGLKFPKKWLEAVEMDAREDDEIWWCAFESWNGRIMNFKQEYLGQWIEEENNFFKIQHRLAAIDYILETEEYDDAIGYLDRSGSIQHAQRVKSRIKETHDWKTVWEFVLKYRDWGLADLREERKRWAELK